jgi:UDP-N-acetylglucosamine 4-epimerase
MIQEETRSTILITGGAGFIGSESKRVFFVKGHKVVCLRHFATGHRHNLKDFVENLIFA